MRNLIKIMARSTYCVNLWHILQINVIANMTRVSNHVVHWMRTRLPTRLRKMPSSEKSIVMKMFAHILDKKIPLKHSVAIKHFVRQEVKPIWHLRFKLFTFCIDPTMPQRIKHSCFHNQKLIYHFHFWFILTFSS